MRKVNKKFLLISGSLLTLLFSYIFSKNSDTLKIGHFTNVANADAAVTTAGSCTPGGSTDSGCSTEGEAEGEGEGEGEGN